ncbi:MAG TPA: MerR family transcriptional regulator [Bryobacteraceae bacterium]|jgi:MerR family redox-sensitive transcriptional activator SoxR
MRIGQLARRSGFSASAIRFYEQSNLLPKPVRVSGKRQYDSTFLEKLAVIERAKACGFSLEEARQLFYGFRPDTPPSARWRALAGRKIEELDQLARQIAMTKKLLQRPCACRDLSECGRRISASRPR